MVEDAEEREVDVGEEAATKQASTVEEKAETESAGL